MNKTIAFIALACAALAANAQEQGRVLSATPVTQQVAIPQQVCAPETIYSAGRPATGAGALMGAVAGGALGNAIGGGGGRAAATALGVFGGAILGNQVEGSQTGGYQNVQRCTTETYYDNQLVGYDVVYEYAGRRYTTRTPGDPGPWIALTVQPVAQPAPLGYRPSSNPLGVGYPQGYARPGVVVSTQPGPAAYVVQPPMAVIEYRNAYGHPYRAPHHAPYYAPYPQDRYWR